MATKKAERTIETEAVHGGEPRSHPFDALSAPIVQTATYTFRDTAELTAFFEGRTEREEEYGRYGNPTVAMFEDRLAAYEGAEAAFATASGMAAMHASMFAQLEAGDHVVASRALFGSCLYVIETLLPRFGVDITLVDGADLDSWAQAVGPKTKLAFLGHGLMENRSGLLVDACLTTADGHGERVAALHMIERHADRPGRITLGGDKGYDVRDFVNELRSMNVTPHVARNTANRRSAIDGRTTRHGGYGASQRQRKRIEEAFGWIKTVAGQRKTRFRGRGRVGWAFTFAAAAYNLVRLPRLMADTA